MRGLIMPHILILMSDTGGGHRAAGEAIQQAVAHLDQDGSFTVEMIDFIKEIAIPPWHHLGRIYKPMVDQAAWLWAFGFKLTSFSALRKVGLALNASITAPKMVPFFRTHRADLVVSVHPFATSVPGYILGRVRPEVPFVTIVTDLVSGHPFWYSRHAHKIFLPSDEAYQRAIKQKIPAQKLELTGLPIDLRFAEQATTFQVSQSKMKQHYGLPPDRAMVLLIGGGDGIGKLDTYAEAIASANLPLSLMVIAGRNESLRQRLSEKEWPIPTKITGFVRDMPHRMAAADILITKAGPGTLCEGLASALPILMTSFIPGQEEGNVHWLTKNQAGQLTSSAEELIHGLHQLVNEHGLTPHYHVASQAAQKLARPTAALTIAQRLIDLSKRLEA